MKYAKSKIFTTEQLSVKETIIETEDVVSIAKDIIQKIADASDKKEIDLAINNLDQANKYLSYIKNKTDIALKYVPDNIKEKEFL